jgi:hypothetical protein
MALDFGVIAVTLHLNPQDLLVTGAMVGRKRGRMQLSAHLYAAGERILIDRSARAEL